MIHRGVRTSLQKAVNAIVLFSVHNADYSIHSPRATKKGRRWKTGKAEHKLAFGQAGKGEGGGTISAEGGQYPLADYVRGGQNPLADYVRGDKICSDTGT